MWMTLGTGVLTTIDEQMCPRGGDEPSCNILDPHKPPSIGIATCKAVFGPQSPFRQPSLRTTCRSHICPILFGFSNYEIN